MKKLFGNVAVMIWGVRWFITEGQLQTVDENHNLSEVVLKWFGNKKHGYGSFLWQTWLDCGKHLWNRVCAKYSTENNLACLRCQLCCLVMQRGKKCVRSASCGPDTNTQRLRLSGNPKELVLSLVFRGLAAWNKKKKIKLSHWYFCCSTFSHQNILQWQ